MIEFQTSGTTGEPKDIVLTDAQLQARIDRLGITRGPEFLKLKSFYYASNATNGPAHYYESYCAKTGVVMLRPTGDHDKTIAMLNEQKPEGYIGGAADAARLANDKALTHKFNYIRVSSAYVDPKAGQAILDKLLAKDGVAYVGYGTREMSTRFLGSLADAIRIPGCVGKPVAGVEYAIDPDQQIRFKVNPKIGSAERYADKALTDKHFKTIDGVLWFYPGDKAELTQDGLLVLKGRV